MTGRAPPPLDFKGAEKTHNSQLRNELFGLMQLMTPCLQTLECLQVTGDMVPDQRQSKDSS